MTTTRPHSAVTGPSRVAVEVAPNQHDDGPWPGLYETRVRRAADAISTSAPFDHTMADDLGAYVTQRVPEEPLLAAACRRLAVEIHGVYPTHLPDLATRHGYRSVRPLGAREQPAKPLNSVRPQLFSAWGPFDDERLIVAVPPGTDYVSHYAAMVRHLLRNMTAHADDMMSVWHYPVAERRIAYWTGLDDHVLGGATTVVLGKVEALREELDRGGHVVSHQQSTPFYTAWTFVIDGRSVTLLGVHFSYWGSIGALLAERCCELGATEILYTGKLGTLTTPSDVYDRLYIPSRYAILDGLRIRVETAGPPNDLLRRMPALDSGLHVSVATVLEEGHLMRRAASALGASTVDNELAQMAVAIENWNSRHCGSVRFGALHYATDYLRRADELRCELPYSLARGRTVEARARRRTAEQLVTDCLARHLSATYARPARKAG